MDKVIAQIGQIIEVNGKQYWATEGGFEPVVKRGPLGGELVKYQDVGVGNRFYIPAYLNHEGLIFTEHDTFSGINKNTLVETNIPARPKFTPMTAGEAAKLPDIVGRWVAVHVSKASDPEFDSCALRVTGDVDDTFFDNGDPILLIEGVDL